MVEQAVEAPSCVVWRALIHPYIDGEMNGDQAVGELCRHLIKCEECAVSYRNQLILIAIIRDNSLHYGAPHHLQKRIRSALREEL